MKDENNLYQWNPVKEIMGNKEILLGRELSYQFVNNPRKILYTMSYYKFAAKMIGSRKKVLHVGCGEGLGTWLLAKECGYARGIDTDIDSIRVAMNTWTDKIISFEAIDFFLMKKEEFYGLVSVDLPLPHEKSRFFKHITGYISHDGVAVIVTPNVISEQYVNSAGENGYWKQLLREMEQYFHHVFIFGATGEVIHTDFLMSSPYLILMGCRKRTLQLVNDCKVIRR